jgi:hypothetical protein
MKVYKETYVGKFLNAHNCLEGFNKRDCFVKVSVGFIEHCTL